jgi:hypothetical protein
MKDRPASKLSVATYKLAKKRREAAAESSEVTGERRPNAYPRILLFPGKEKLIVGAPTFSGTMPVQVAPGVHWSAPPGSRVIQPVTGSKRAVYILNAVTGHLHFLRVNERGAVEEVRLPKSALGEARERFGFK